MNPNKEYVARLTFTLFLEVYLVYFHSAGGNPGLSFRSALLPFQQMLNIDDGVVLVRQGSLVQRVLEQSMRERRAGRGEVRGGLGGLEKDWLRIRSSILSALELFPGARESVVQALVELRAMEGRSG